MMKLSQSFKKRKTLWLLLGIAIIFVATYLIRAFPYFAETVIPFGYDPGIYKAIFESYRANLPDIDVGNIAPWMRSNPIGLFLFTNILYLFSYSSGFILTHLFAFLSAIVGIFIYLIISYHFPKHKLLAAFISVAFYFVSVTQYQVFWWNYYKNVLSIILLLASVMLLYRKNWLAFLTLGFLMVVHRPTGLYAGGLIFIYILYNFISALWEGVKTKKGAKPVIEFLKNSLEIKVGIAVLLIMIFVYRGNFAESIAPAMKSVMKSFNLQYQSGSFFTIPEYLYYSLWYWPLAIYGLIVSVKNRRFSYVESGFVFGVIWVFLRMYFYNRMIILLDIFVIAMAAVGCMLLLTEAHKKHFHKIIAVIVLIFMALGWKTVDYVRANLHPLIYKEEFEFINTIPEITEENAIVISTHSNYSPWLVGYSGRDVLAPGLFDLNQWSKSKWIEFWDGDTNTKAEMLKEYNDLKKPIYIYIGLRQANYSFDNSDCFIYLHKNNFSFIKYLCGEQ